MHVRYIGLSIIILIAGVWAISVIGPSETPTGQYHPISQIWINDYNLDWKGVSFTNINNLYLFGKLGIGTANPSAKLHVKDTSKQILIEESDTGKQWHLEVQNKEFRIVETGVDIRMTINPGGDTHINGNLYVSKICLNSDCSAVIYWDNNNNQLVIQAPNIVVVKTQ